MRVSALSQGRSFCASRILEGNSWGVSSTVPETVCPLSCVGGPDICYLRGIRAESCSGSCRGCCRVRGLKAVGCYPYNFITLKAIYKAFYQLTKLESRLSLSDTVLSVCSPKLSAVECSSVRVLLLKGLVISSFFSLYFISLKSLWLANMGT